MDQAEFRVSANLDQLQTKAPELLYLNWEESKDRKGSVIKNRVNMVFSQLGYAQDLYQKLKDKKMVAFRNWIF